MKVSYMRLREDRIKSNGDWEFNKLTRTVSADVTCKTEKEFDKFSELMSAYGYEPSLCPATEDDSYSDSYYFDIDDKKDFIESYKACKMGGIK